MSGLEILGLAASVIQIAELGGKLSVKIFTFTRKVKNANKSIDALSQEIAVTGAVLQQLGQTLSSDGSVKVCSQEAIDTARELVGDTERVFKNLESLLDTEEKPNSRFRKAVNLQKRLKFPFLESEIEQVQANLERLKSSLLVILNVLIFAEQIRNRETPAILEDQRELLRTLAAEKDANEQRYESILKAIADRPAQQAPDGKDPSGTSRDLDAASTYSSTLTLVQSDANTSSTSLPPVQQTVSKVSEPPELELPPGLKHHHQKIHHHTLLVQNLLSEIDSLDYKIDHASRGRLQSGVLDAHWNEWTVQRKNFGGNHFLRILENSSEVAGYWTDKIMNEVIAFQESQKPVKVQEESEPAIEPKPGVPQTEIDKTVEQMRQNISGLSERGSRLEDLVPRTGDLSSQSKMFYRQTKQQGPDWFGIISAPVGWVGNAVGAVGSLPGKLWNTASEGKPSPQSPIPPKSSEPPILPRSRFTHTVPEARYRRKDVEEAAKNPKIGTLAPDDSKTYIAWRKRMNRPELTFDRCSRELLDIFRVTFDTFDVAGLGKAPFSQIGDMMRTLGYDMSDGQLTCAIVVASSSVNAHNRMYKGIGDGISFEVYITLMLNAMATMKDTAPTAGETKENGIHNDLGSLKDKYKLSGGTQSGDNSTNSSQPNPSDRTRGVLFAPSAETRPSPTPASELDARVVENLKGLFQLSDKDNTGSIDATKFGEIIDSLGLAYTDEELKGMLTEQGYKDGIIDLNMQEYLALMTNIIAHENAKVPDDHNDTLYLSIKPDDQPTNASTSPSKLRTLSSAPVPSAIKDADVEQIIAELDLLGPSDAGGVDVEEIQSALLAQPGRGRRSASSRWRGEAQKGSQKPQYLGRYPPARDGQVTTRETPKVRPDLKADLMKFWEGSERGSDSSSAVTGDIDGDGRSEKGKAKGERARTARASSTTFLDRNEPSNQGSMDSGQTSIDQTPAQASTSTPTTEEEEPSTESEEDSRSGPTTPRAASPHAGIPPTAGAALSDDSGDPTLADEPPKAPKTTAHTTTPKDSETRVPSPPPLKVSTEINIDDLLLRYTNLGREELVQAGLA